MKKNYISYKDKIEIYKNITLLFLILFLCYGFYKNGLVYYFMGKLPIKEALKLFMFPILSITECLGIERILTKKNTKDSLLMSLICSLLIPPMFPIIPFTIITGCFYFIYYLLKENMKTVSFIAIYKGTIMLYTLFFSIPLENQIENTNSYFYGLIDTLFGHGIGGFGTTNIALILLLFIILCSYFYYKKEIPILSMVSYTILFFLFLLINPNKFILSNLLESSFFFTTVLLLPINHTSPVIKRVKILYAISFGALSFFLIHFFNIKEGAYLVLIIINILWSIAHKLVYKKN